MTTKTSYVNAFIILLFWRDLLNFELYAAAILSADGLFAFKLVRSRDTIRVFNAKSNDNNNSASKEYT